AILLANLAFRISRPQIGLALYDGVGEIDLGNLYDTHAYSAVANVHAVAAEPGLVRTAHGLTVMPSLAASANDGADSGTIRHLDRFVIPATDGDPRAARVVAAVRSVVPALLPDYLYARSDHRFNLERVIEDLARTVDAPTGRLALRRLEYRSQTIRLAGSLFPWRLVPLPLATGLLGLLIAVALSRILRSYIRRRASGARPRVGSGGRLTASGATHAAR